MKSKKEKRIKIKNDKKEYMKKNNSNEEKNV